jgi:bacterial/archaeal transporter family-2 protein
MTVIFVLLAVLAGLSNPIQSGSNSELLKITGAPVVSALMIYAVGVLCLLACAPFLGLPVKSAVGKAAGAPWWPVVSGVCNATFLLVSVMVAKKLGSGTFTTLVVITAVLLSVGLDHFGLLGFQVRHATPLRLLGCAFAFVGVLFIGRF